MNECVNRLLRRLPVAGSWLLIGCLLTACATPGPEPTHPLLNQIRESASGEALTRAQLLDRMAAADVVYIGEKHDHPDQHQLQRDLLAELVARGAKPALGLEVVPAQDTSLLMTYAGSAGAHHGAQDGGAADARLARQLGWGGVQDENWRFYGPLLQLAREHKLTLFGADLSVPLRGRITMVGRAGLSAVEQRGLTDTGLDDANYRSLMVEQFKAAHCGWGSPEYLGKLYDNWLARNDSMAANILATRARHKGGPVVLVAGAGHMVLNRGVYERVAFQAPALKQFNLGLVELVPGADDAAAYLKPTVYQGRDYGPDHQVVWFTRPMERDQADLCQQFEQRKATAPKAPATAPQSPAAGAGAATGAAADD